MSGTHITPQEVKRFNELYSKIGTYAGVARATGRSASSVKRYIHPNAQKAYIQAYKNELKK